MSGAVDHPFLDQLGTHRTEAGHFHLQSIGDISGALGSWAELGHGTEEILLGRGEPIVAHAKEILVEP